MYQEISTFIYILIKQNLMKNIFIYVYYNSMNYYVNTISGKDTNTGTSVSSALLTLTKIPNGSNVIFVNDYIREINLSKKTDITIERSKGLPILKTTFINLSSCKNIKIVNISVSTSYFLPTPTITKPSNKGITLRSCNNCIIDKCELFSERSTLGWTAEQWNINATGILISGGNENKILNSKVMNCGGIQVKGNNNLIDSNFISDFPTDGFGVWASGNIISNNVIQNSHKVNNNHNDLLQCGTSSNNTIIGNTLRAYTDPKQPFIARDVQGLGCFDGWYDNFIVKNNTVIVDHPIGIWFQGVKNSIIDGNIVKICGTKLYNNRTPCIFVDVKKSGDASSNIIVTNNTSPHFELLSGIVKQSNNYASDIKKYI